MSSDLKPFTIWGEGGINPTKVAIFFEELGLPYSHKEVLLADIKKPEYTSINPNGRLPSIYDPNTDITLWESGAIIEYLVEKYDKKLTISFAPESKESYLAKQWLHYQVSGQGPYYGQAAWFKLFSKEDIPSAKKRYNEEVNRVSTVLEFFLAQRAKVSQRNGGPWLVGDKCSYADLAFITWQRTIAFILAKEDYDLDNYPYVKDWLDRMALREGVKAAMDNMKPLK
ncbi:Fc.00g104980.m01.CDS01 [Cosmosporella sp. VM-42]